MSKKEMPEKEMKEASKKFFTPFISNLLDKIRKIEKIIYSKIVLRFNYLYFDSEEVSADLKKQKDQKYLLDVNITDEKPRKQIQKDLSE